MNRTTLLVIAGIIVSMLVLPFFVMAQPSTSSSLGKVWNAISNLKQEIAKLKISISNLEQQVNDTHIESRIAIFNITTQTQNGVNVSCNNDEIATGGGIKNNEQNANAYLVDFYPIDERTWRVRVSGNLNYGTIRLVCVKY